LRKILNIPPYRKNPFNKGFSRGLCEDALVFVNILSYILANVKGFCKNFLFYFFIIAKKEGKSLSILKNPSGKTNARW